MSSLKISGLNKVFPSGETALYNVSLEANDKEFLVFVGGENSGKSTLLRIIAGLEDATGGELLIDGKDVTEVDPKNRDIAMVFKNSTLYPALNVFDNIAFGLRLRKAPEALVKERVKVAAEILGLNDVLFRKPKVLSAADKQRVAIGRAIVREPRLYLFDDPLSGLDEKLRQDMLNLLINLQARLQGTFIYCTKNLSEALTIGTRLVILKDGFVQQIDTPANIYDYPANTYAAFFLGSPTINFIEKAKITEEEGRYFAAFAGGKIELPENIVTRFGNIASYKNTDKSVTLGIRPEDAKTGEEGQLEGRVSTLSESGENYAEIDIAPDISLNVATCGNVEKGKTVKISVDATKIYVFDAETRLTLLNRDGGYTQTGLPDAGYVPLSFEEEQAVKESLKPKKQQKKK